ncbi:hypothetical protein [Rhodococcus sp. IEGM 1408]|uniref:hypothetical protein n=1 Tax=Rhodococcus sp. IEGM 1408 TaxID=3082220 RepID=UPI0029529FD3|nr:hypothetical protein [Rhodococcus sp. IEGM 1408]MDV8000015.1 hypothetical protein [Rhodococcus sp. IEGM 1408]
MTADNVVATEATSDHDTTTHGSAAESTTDEGAARAPGRPIRPGRVAVALIVVALLAACGYLGSLAWADHREDELRRSATEDAARLVVQLATYDHTDVDANLDAVVAEATPGFADRYREVSEGLRELLASGQGTSAGTAAYAGVQSVDAGRAVVLVFLDQEVTNVTVPEGRVDSSRMVVTLIRDGDRWLLDAAELA